VIRTFLPTTQIQSGKSKKEQIYQQVKVSPGGDYIAYVTNDWGRKRIWLYNQATGKKKIIFRKEPKFEQVVDNTYPVIAWHPSGKILTYINDEKSDLQMYFYRVNEKKQQKESFFILIRFSIFLFSGRIASCLFCCKRWNNRYLYSYYCIRDQ
jgi:protease II